jgi:hypothetical protein
MRSSLFLDVFQSLHSLIPVTTVYQTNGIIGTVARTATTLTDGSRGRIQMVLRVKAIDSHTVMVRVVVLHSSPFRASVVNPKGWLGVPLGHQRAKTVVEHWPLLLWQ